MLLLKYFLVVGSVLTGLIFFSNSGDIKGLAPFRVSQISGLPKPYKAPIVVAEVGSPIAVATEIVPTINAKPSTKTVLKHKPAKVVGRLVPQGRYDPFAPLERWAPASLQRDYAFQHPFGLERQNIQ